MAACCLQVSVLPRCSSVGAILEARSFVEGLQLLFSAVGEAALVILTDSYISLGAVAFMFAMSFGFASSGGVGASPVPPPSSVSKFARGRDSLRRRMALK